jgi:hypothetical protein
MEHKKNELKSSRVTLAATAALGIVMAGAVIRLSAYEALQSAKGENQSMIIGSNFFCNIKALRPAERAHHERVTKKIISGRAEVVETEKGYEFQFDPSVLSVAELADWVAAESKCCPFFDFHIDLEHEGKLVCLRLTGAPGIKRFIRSEFQIPPKRE